MRGAVARETLGASAECEAWRFWRAIRTRDMAPMPTTTCRGAPASVAMSVVPLTYAGQPLDAGALFRCAPRAATSVRVSAQSLDALIVLAADPPIASR